MDGLPAGNHPVFAETIDLGPYINSSAVAVQETFSIERTYTVFRTMGLRHLVVVDRHNHVKGIVTRKVGTIHVKRPTSRQLECKHGDRLSSITFLCRTSWASSWTMLSIRQGSALQHLAPCHALYQLPRCRVNRTCCPWHYMKYAHFGKMIDPTTFQSSRMLGLTDARQQEVAAHSLLVGKWGMQASSLWQRWRWQQEAVIDAATCVWLQHALRSRIWCI